MFYQKENTKKKKKMYTEWWNALLFCCFNLVTSKCSPRHSIYVSKQSHIYTHMHIYRHTHLVNRVENQCISCSSQNLVTWLGSWQRLTSSWRGSLLMKFIDAKLTSQYHVTLMRNQLFGALLFIKMAENVYALWTVLLLIHQTLNTFDPINYP